MRTTILVFHHDPARSRTGRAMTNAASHVDGVEVVDMGELYPDGRINGEAEVERLLAAERIVLQFPVLWYSTPPLLKTWQDEVLFRLYYLSPDLGEHLRGLPVFIAGTAGSRREQYTPEGGHLYSLEDLLKPLRSTANRCYWKWTEPYLLYEVHSYSDEHLAGVARDYAQRIASWTDVKEA